MVGSQLASSVHNWGLVPLHDLVFTPPGGWKIARSAMGPIVFFDPLHPRMAIALYLLNPWPPNKKAVTECRVNNFPGQANV